MILSRPIVAEDDYSVQAGSSDRVGRWRPRW
ncbi:hypothetical protein L288_16475 [Sphingobium quisquiliarum P25]|uniref:Uncharacterized protein n=1 Tax=Sphingobium quisquiliarum P25 TaxID=1329909 RepID=T0HTE4_9SPHN|nr:hypothetical protein L288_16475 [Sphingobium quisquiliarum P25]